MSSRGRIDKYLKGGLLLMSVYFENVIILTTCELKKNHKIRLD